MWYLEINFQWFIVAKHCSCWRMSFYHLKPVSCGCYTDVILRILILWNTHWVKGITFTWMYKVSARYNFKSLIVVHIIVQCRILFIKFITFIIIYTVRSLDPVIFFYHQIVLYTIFYDTEYDVRKKYKHFELEESRIIKFIV